VASVIQINDLPLFCGKFGVLCSQLASELCLGDLELSNSLNEVVLFIIQLTDVGAAPLPDISCHDGRTAWACARPPPRKVGKLLSGGWLPMSDWRPRRCDRRTGPVQFSGP
jgi:hypothetical protein